MINSVYIREADLQLPSTTALCILKIWKFYIYVSKKSEKNSYDTYACFLRACRFSVQKTSYSELYKNNKILVSV